MEDLQCWPVRPIIKIAAGGYTLAALNSSGDLYCWGSPPKHFQILGELTGTPSLVDIDGGKELVDVAVGHTHMIVLTKDGEIYGIGAGRNGQLGLGEEHAQGGKPCTSWTKVDLAVSDGYRIVGIAAGPLSSFIMAKRQYEEPQDS